MIPILTPLQVPQPVSSQARLDLSTITDIPSDIKQIYMVSTDSQRKLTACNPIKLKTEIDSICGPVEELSYQRNGSLLITVANNLQINNIIKAENLPSLNISIKSTIAWNHKFTYGKIYAPELLEDSLAEILDMLSCHRVVAVRKLFNDSNRQHIPLYVLTFLGQIPPSMKVGYVKYKIDKYYPSPLRCKKCWRFGHTKNNCRNKETCSYCSSTNHIASQCDAEAPKCINCRDTHESLSNNCSFLTAEREICSVTADRGISFKEARALVKNRNKNKLLNYSSKGQTSTNELQTNHSHVDFQLSNHRFPPLIIEGAPAQTERTTNIEEACDHTSTNHPTADNNVRPEYSQPSFNWGRCPAQTRVPVTQNHYNPLDNLEASQRLPTLPTLSPRYRTTTSKLSKENLKQPMEYLSPDESRGNETWDLSAIVPKLIPLVIKFLFLQSLTDKIECLTQIGKILNLESIITEALLNINVTSISTSQENSS